jgi:hypothetical protein
MKSNLAGTIRSLTFASILLPLLMISMIRSANAQCPPVGLLTHDDYLVATGQLTGGTVGIDQCGQFIVAYSTVDFEGTQVFARRLFAERRSDRPQRISHHRPRHGPVRPQCATK